MKTKINKYIRSVGIEVEGGMNRNELLSLEMWLRNNGIIEHFSKGTDSSVNVEEKELDNLELRFWHYDIFILCTFVQKLLSLDFCRMKRVEIIYMYVSTPGISHMCLPLKTLGMSLFKDTHKNMKKKNI